MTPEQSAAPGEEKRDAKVVDESVRSDRPSDPVLPEVTRDESDSWGERHEDDEDLERFNRERPPHHI